MLELKNITKVYETESFKQKALNKVNINFRKNEFVSILGQSGSGKTTLLNIVGGLDNYTKGNLLINGISTKEYKDRDWDIYRNHKVGFIFQSYNLIGHQTVLANVELALTLSGVSPKERRRRAKRALRDVGLGEHMKKKPNQLSGGQMQRVAIARALINDPEIILADEPTGALDSETSTQIMKILKKVAEDRLVIMVTHNPELANEYSTRIINLKDGEITGDSNPYEGGEYQEQEETKKKRKKKNSMSHKTAFGLSMNNLMTKKGRTILTAFAGSIGIIGIAVILSVSTGVQEFIDRTEEETLSSYPLTIESQTIDLNSFSSTHKTKEKKCDKNTVCSKNIMEDILSATSSSKISNDLEKLKTYLEDNKKIQKNVNDIKYKYGFDLQIYTNKEKDNVKVNPNTLMYTMMGQASGTDMSNMASMPSSSMTSQNIFTELMDNDRMLKSQYQILKGRMPQKYNEVVLIVDDDNQLVDYVMYVLGLKDQKDIVNFRKDMIEGKEFKSKDSTFTYDDLLNLTFKAVVNADMYEKQYGVWTDKSKNPNEIEELIDNGIELKVVGILKPNEEATTALTNVVGYKKELTNYIMEQNNKSQIAKEQQENPNIDVFTGQEFNELQNSLDMNLQRIGVAKSNKPSTIEIYPKSFNSKEKIEDILSDYNSKAKKENREEDSITYTDYVGIIMSGVTSIIDVITIGLIGFVSISLIVSSIMIAIITYISVLERTKEIGILRAIGASKKDISRVFNAETFIEGLFAGIFGIIITILINIPINLIIKSYSDISNIATLNPIAAIILIIISVLLTVLAGFIPAKIAAKKDPVESLRTE